MDLAGDRPGHREEAGGDRRLVYDPVPPAPPAWCGRAGTRPLGGPGVRRVQSQGAGPRVGAGGSVLTFLHLSALEMDGFRRGRMR
jgi:hypothetical protein